MLYKPHVRAVTGPILVRQKRISSTVFFKLVSSLSPVGGGGDSLIFASLVLKHSGCHSVKYLLLNKCTLNENTYSVCFCCACTVYVCIWNQEWLFFSVFILLYCKNAPNLN